MFIDSLFYIVLLGFTFVLLLGKGEWEKLHTSNNKCTNVLHHLIIVISFDISSIHIIIIIRS